jgi:G3E family GTPase
VRGACGGFGSGPLWVDNGERVGADRPPLDVDEFDNVAAQLGAAHTIAMTKLDLASAEQRRLARESIAGFNPLAQVVDADSVRDRAREAFGDTQADPLHEWTAPSFQRESRRALLHPRVRIFCARSRDTPAWEQTLDWMENISGALGECANPVQT